MFKHYESCNISCACSSCFSVPSLSPALSLLLHAQVLHQVNAQSPEADKPSGPPSGPAISLVLSSPIRSMIHCLIGAIMSCPRGSIYFSGQISIENLLIGMSTPFGSHHDMVGRDSALTNVVVFQGWFPWTTCPW